MTNLVTLDAHQIFQTMERTLRPPVPLHPLEEKWLDEEIFNWVNMNPGHWQDGHDFSKTLLKAVLTSWKEGKTLEAERHYQEAEKFLSHPHLWPHLRGYAQQQLTIARTFLDNRAVPVKVSKIVNTITGAQQDFEAPNPSSARDNHALEQLIDELSRTDLDSYRAERQQEIEQAKQALITGNIDTSRAPELAAQAVRERLQLEQLESSAADELRQLKARRDSLSLELARRKGSKPPKLGSFSKMWKKVRKQIQRSWEDIRDPVIELRNWVSHNLIPEEARRIGRKIEKEARRFRKRVDAQFKRSLEDIVQQSPWIKAAAPLFGIVPVVGWAFTVLIAATVATAEIAYTARQKRELDQALKRARHELIKEISALEQEIAAFEDRTDVMEEQRLTAFEQSLADSITRVANRHKLESRLTWRRRLLIGGSALILLIAGRRARSQSSNKKRRTLVMASVGIGGLAAWHYWQMKKDLERFGENHGAVSEG